MLKTLKLPLQPTPEQHDGLLATMHRFNAACTWIAQQAHHTRTTNKIALQNSSTMPCATSSASPPN